MKKNQTAGSLILLLTAFIWGFAFIAQSEGGNAVGAFSFNCIRSFIGALVLIPVILFRDKKGNPQKPVSKDDKLFLLKGGVCCGIALCVATNLQQFGMYIGTEAGKAGFLTTTYILLVPILGLFLKKKCGLNVWIGVIITLIGLYLLCINNGFSLQAGDALILMCAFVFAIQILLVDHFAPLVDVVRLASLEFVVAGIGTLPLMFFFDMGTNASSIRLWASNFDSSAWLAILYAGVLSSGVAYTLQMVGQKRVAPTIASMLMSFESVFAVIGGWLLLGEHFTIRESIGCVLIFIAVIIAQAKGSA